MLPYTSVAVGRMDQTCADEKELNCFLGPLVLMVSLSSSSA